MNTNTPELTDDEILQVFADAVGNQEDGARFIDVDRDQAICIARTLLSKLRQGGEPVAWFIDWPDEPGLGHYLAESPAGYGRSRPLVFGDAAPQASSPVADDMQAMLKDPAIVHTNMCRGIIAPITFDMLAHVLGDEATAAWLDSRRASAPVAGEAQPVPMTWDDALRIARGCTDYGGGYRGDAEKYEVYQHGIQTVITALTHADRADSQTRALLVMGAPQASAPVADRQRLRALVDLVWNEATESTEVPDTPWADRLIDKVFEGASAAPQASEAVRPCTCQPDWSNALASKEKNDAE